MTLTNAEYHAHPSLSKSGLDRLAISPAHYQAWLTDPRIETAAMRFGTAAHCAILEPARFEQEYAPLPEGLDRRTKDGKALYAELEATGKTLLSMDDWNTLNRMRDSVLAHPAARELLSEGQAETSHFSELYGVSVKCRPDWLSGGLVVDLKTTQDASLSGFSKSIANYRYAVQHAFYSDILASLGHEIIAFLFIAVEKTAPFAVGVYELDDMSIEIGREQYQSDLDTYRRCVESGEWPAYSNGVEKISLPRWAVTV